MRPGISAAVVTATVCALAVMPAFPAAADGVLVFENRSGQTIKAVATGGKAVIEAGAEPTTVPFEGDDGTGIDVKIWWTAKPRELCQLFVPWGRTVIVTGTRFIRCRSL